VPETTQSGKRDRGLRSAPIAEPLVVKHHPGGVAGALMSLDEVAKRAWKDRNDPRVRAWATQELAKNGSPSTALGKMQVLLDAFRKRVPYISDPVQTELMAGAVQTLCLDDGKLLCVIGGDCDCQTIAFSAVLMSIGIPVHVVGASYKDPIDQPVHVYLEAMDDSGEYLPIDPTTKKPVGQVHAPARVWVIDPNKGVSSDGKLGGDFVGIGYVHSTLGPRGHVVAYGESPLSIASRYGVAVSHLVAANPHKARRADGGFASLQVGERLSVPTRSRYEEPVAPPPPLPPPVLPPIVPSPAPPDLPPPPAPMPTSFLSGPGVAREWGLGAASTGSHLPGTVNEIDVQVQGAADALDAVISGPCKGKVPDYVVAEWQAFRVSWGLVHASWTPYSSEFLPKSAQGLLSTTVLAAVFPGLATQSAQLEYLYQYYESVFGGIYDQMVDYAGKLEGWQKRVASLCPAYKPPPGIVIPPADGGGGGGKDPWDKIKEAAEAVGVAAVVLVGGWVVYKIVK